MNLARKLLPIVLFLFSSLSSAQPGTLAPNIRSKVDALVQQALSDSGVPSASIAIVQAGSTAYVHAYGNARIDPHTPAATSMRYSIGSISKQFTAAAILLLQEQGKLSLDEPISRFV